MDDDGLRGNGRIGTQGKRMLFVEIWRKELHVDRQDAIDERVERIRMRQEEANKGRSDSQDTVMTIETDVS